MAVRTITGVLSDNEGAPISGGKLRITPVKFLYGRGGTEAILSDVREVVANGSGAVSFDLDEGTYVVETSTSKGTARANMVVDAEGPWDLGRLIDLAPQAVPNAAQAAIDAAMRAKAWAESETPPDPADTGSRSSKTWSGVSSAEADRATGQANIATTQAAAALVSAAEADAYRQIAIDAAIAAGAPIVFPPLPDPVPAEGTVVQLLDGVGLRGYIVDDGAWLAGNWVTGPKFDTVDLGFASTASTFGPVGQIVLMEGYPLKVAPAASADYHRATAGGVLLYALDTGDGIPLAAVGVKGDGTTDNSAIIQRMLDVLPSHGGKLLLPDGRVKANIHITRSNVTLVGKGGNDWRLSNEAHITEGRGLMPFVKTDPALTVGFVSGVPSYVVGTHLENLPITSEDGLDFFGLRLAGGCYGLTANGLWIDGFRKYCLHVENGDTVGSTITYVNINNYSFSTARGAGAEADAAAVYTKFNVIGGSVHNGFVTAIHLDNGRIGSREVTAHRIHTDGVRVSVSNSWIECHDNAGIKISHTDGETPMVTLSNTLLDSPSSSDTLVEVFHPSTTELADYIRGSGSISGMWANGSGTKMGVSGMLRDVYSMLAWPRISGAMAFPEPGGDITDISARILAAGPAGARNLELYGGVTRLIGGAAQVLSNTGTGYARLRVTEIDSGADGRIEVSAARMTIAPPAGKPLRAAVTWQEPLDFNGLGYMWVASGGTLYFKPGSAPTSDTDGTLIA